MHADEVMTDVELVRRARGQIEIALTEIEPGLKETAFYDPVNFTFPAGCHIAEVEVDPDTGAVRRAVPLPEQLFGEGITVVDDRIWQLTYTDGVAQGFTPANLQRAFGGALRHVQLGGAALHQRRRVGDVAFDQFHVGRSQGRRLVRAADEQLHPPLRLVTKMIRTSDPGFDLTVDEIDRAFLVIGIERHLRARLCWCLDFTWVERRS